MIKAGMKAPSFRVRTDTGGELALEDLRGRPVVLYFYPKDDTPGCTVQACEFRDAWEQVQAAGAVVLGVSPDGVEDHVKFRDKFELPFPLLADEDHAVADAYGTWGEKSLFGVKYMGVLRTTFIIDGAGVVRRVFERVKPQGHAQEVLEAVAAL